MTKKIRTAVIDVGTLKCKFEVQEFDQDLNSTVITRQKELTVLGRDLDKTNGMIIRKAIETTVEALVYGSTNIIDFMKAMDIKLSKRESGGEHPYWVDIFDLNPLYDKIVALSYEDRMPMYPAEPYYMWAADKALMNIFQISQCLGTTIIVPSNNNISTGILQELAMALL